MWPDLEMLDVVDVRVAQVHLASQKHQRNLSWRRWARQAMDGGAKQGHQWTKLPQKWEPPTSVCDTTQGRSAHP